jgi:hypothetical protein
MPDNNDVQTCLNCGNNEQQIPLVSMRFNGVDNWICSQCLPILIHKPQQLIGKLPGINPIAVAGHEH